MVPSSFTVFALRTSLFSAVLARLCSITKFAFWETAAPSAAIDKRIKHDYADES